MLLTPLQVPLRRSHHHLPDLPSKYTALFAWGIRVSDVLVVIVAGVCAYWLHFGQIELSMPYHRAIGRGFLLSLVVFSASPLYRSWRGRGLARECLTMAAVYTTLFVVGAIYIGEMKLAGELSRVWRLEWFLSCLVAGTAVRIVIRRAAAYTRSRGLDVRTAVLVGGSNDAHRIIDALHHNRWAGINVLGRFQVGDTGLRVDGVPYLGDVRALAEYVEHQHIDQVWIALPVSEQQQINDILEALRHSTADIKFVPDLFGLQLLNHSVEQVAGLPVINLRASALNGDAYLLKAIENRIIAAVILVIVSPLMAVLAIGVKLSSPGPILFRQQRHGLDGKLIDVWKFRSMRMHQEPDGHVTQATRFDRRVTPFGRFLRSTSLDELPQFFNVLQGTMAVVGPRPHAVAHNHQYKVVVQDYMQRHRIKPGITGWAQVNGLRGEIDDIDKMKARVQYDLYYMQNWSLLFDLRIIAMTVFKGFFGRNAY
ncbi:undecaprenyl-phosphate glucose phosphotransferase [Cognatiluteimonas profundi]|uniref:undecaprenyl-phosphate glucose phosphotransferase n=1 Tax=Cognatiluteimonas profundi TaxID=2594501 RepID=UPI00131E5183|nr:undecaprenyl-phosphate glucose phosphotransferase [Lysobacter profundi]